MNRNFLIYRISTIDVIKLNKHVLTALQERKNKSSFAPAGSEIDGYPERGGHMKLADKLAKTAGKMSPRKLILLCAFFALMIFIILYSTLSSFEGKKEE